MTRACCRRPWQCQVEKKNSFFFLRLSKFREINQFSSPHDFSPSLLLLDILLENLSSSSRVPFTRGFVSAAYMCVFDVKNNRQYEAVKKSWKFDFSLSVGWATAEGKKKMRKFESLASNYCALHDTTA